MKRPKDFFESMFGRSGKDRGPETKGIEVDAGIRRREWAVGDKLLNRFEIKGVLKGGMGVVYIALDHEWNQHFAIKTFQDKFLWNEEIINRFMAEAETWVNLERHTNIVFANFIMKIEGKPLIFLECIDGGDLGQFVGRLDIPQALNFAIQFCTGMDYAYNKLGIIHRDIKPGNVMVARDDRFRFGYSLKVSDFGLVKTAHISAEFISRSEVKEIIGEASLTQFGASFGTPEYMPPEQFLDARKVDTRGDVYSAMVMLYQMFTGVLPFQVSWKTQKERFEKYKEKHLYEKPINPMSINPKIPERLGRLMMKCLEKKTENRYQSFKELKNDLIEIYNDCTGEKYVIIGKKEPLTEIDWNNKGGALDNLGRHREAIECYDKALDINPGYADAWYNKGLALYDLGRRGEAIECFDKALGINPRHVAAWSSKGVAFDELGKYREVIECCDEALDINPKFADAWNNKGLTLANLGIYGEAIECYNNALDINPRDTATWYNKGTALSKLGRYGEAIECYDKALDINPKMAKAWNNKGIALRNLGRYEEAIKCCDRVLDINPSLVEAWNNKGNALGNLGRYGEAIECFERFVELAPPQYATRIEEAKRLIISLGGRFE